MAWGGKIKTRMGVTQRKNSLPGSIAAASVTDDNGRAEKLLRSGNRPAVLHENLSSDPVKFNTRLQQLLTAYRLNTKG